MPELQERGCLSWQNKSLESLSTLIRNEGTLYFMYLLIYSLFSLHLFYTFSISKMLETSY